MNDFVINIIQMPSVAAGVKWYFSIRHNGALIIHSGKGYDSADDALRMASVEVQIALSGAAREYV